MPDHTSEPRLLPGATSPALRGPEAADESVSLGHLLGVLRRRSRLVLGTIVACTAIGGFIGYTEPQVYRASASLRLAGERTAMTGEERASEVRRSTDPILSAVQLVKSRSVLAAVVDTLGLRLVPQDEAFPRQLLGQVEVDPRTEGDSVLVTFLPDKVTARLGAREATAAYGEVLHLGTVRFAVMAPPAVPAVVLQTVPEAIAIDILQATIEILPREGTDIIDVALAAPDPWYAQQVVNATVQLYQHLNVSFAVAKSRRRREFLEQQLAGTDSLLMLAQAELASFRSRQQLASSQSALQAQQSALLALDARRAELESDRATFGTLLRQLRAGDETSRAEALRALAASPAVGDNPEVTSLYRQMSTFQYRLDSMTTGPWSAAPTNPDVIQLRSLIGSTQQQLSQAVSSHVASIDARIGSLGALRARSGASIQILPAMAEEELRLTRRVEALSNVGDQTRKDYQRARMAEAVEAGDMEIVDLASLPYQPIWQSASMKLTIGFFLGLLLGVGLAFLLEALNTSIRRPEDLEGMLHLPGLAVIPRLTGTPHRPHSGLAGLLGAGRKGGTLEVSRRAATLGTAAQPFSIGTEAFRMLRTSLIWTDGGAQLKTIVVTSAAPGEGKTLTAANLAVTFAHDGLQVLLVDCDIRRPRLHGVFKVPRSPGLIDLLTTNRGEAPGVGSLAFDPEAGRDGGSDALTAVIRPTPIHGLSLLTCGALPSNPANLLSGLRIRALLEEFNRRFDLVILDTPPVLATADAGIVGSLADGVLLVVRAGQTDRTAARRAQQQLTNAGARILGAVLNDPGGEVSEHGDYYYPYEYAAERE